MKTKAWVIFALAFLFAVTANATDLPKMNIIQVEESTALVAYQSVTTTPLLVTLTNSHGDILYHKETERCKEFKKMFDLSELGDGEFCVCINYGNQSISRKISITGKSITVDNAMRCYEPYFCMKNKRLNVSFLNTSLKPVFLNVYKDGEHLYGYNLGRNFCIHKGFDMSRLNHGIYEVVLTDNVKDHKYLTEL